MEHIGGILARLRRETSIPNPIFDPEELTPEQKREELRKALGVSSFKNTFEALKPWPGTEKALAAFKALASGKAEWKMLLCYGGVGNGKTHFCEATVIELYKRGLFCRVLIMDRIMGRLKECMNPNEIISPEELLNRYCCAPMLIIDDVDGTVWEFEQLEKIIRARYRENLFTILTSNLDIKADEKDRDKRFIPERIVSRFRDKEKGRLIWNKGDDYRPEKGKS